MALLAPVHLHNGLRIDGKLLVWVDDHTEKAGVRLQRARREKASASCLPETQGQTELPCTAGQVVHCTTTSGRGTAIHT